MKSKILYLLTALLLLVPIKVFGANTKSVELIRDNMEYFSTSDSASLSLTDHITLQAWIKLDSLPGHESGDPYHYIIMSKWDTDLQSYFFSVEKTGYHLAWRSSDNASGTSANWVEAVDNSSLTTGQWYHVAVTYDGGTVTFYVDGVQKTTTYTYQNSTSIVDTGSAFQVGSAVNGAIYHFDGHIDDARVYSVVRNATDITSDWKQEISSFTNVSAYWKFNDDGLDETTNNNDLTAYNTPTYSTDIPDWTIPPVADFSGTPTSGIAPLEVTFTDESDPAGTSWYWQFGDGNTTTTQNPVHSYTYAGSYNVIFEATGEGGQSTSTKNGYITVTSTTPPTPTATSSIVSMTDFFEDGNFYDVAVGLFAGICFIAVLNGLYIIINRFRNFLKQ